MEHHDSLKKIKKEYHGTFVSYAIGFTVSLLLTLASFALVLWLPFSVNTIVYTLITLAIIQAIIQLLLFLHVGQEAKPRWETLALLFTTVTLLTIVIGSLWVMNDLNMRMMPDMNMEGMNHMEGMKHD